MTDLETENTKERINTLSIAVIEACHYIHEGVNDFTVSVGGFTISCEDTVQENNND